MICTAGALLKCLLVDRVFWLYAMLYCMESIIGGSPFEIIITAFGLTRSCSEWPKAAKGLVENMRDK